MDRKIHARMDRPIHCPAQRGSQTIAPVRSSTQERFRRDVLGVPPGPGEPATVPAGMVVVAPPAPDALKDLLAGYRRRSTSPTTSRRCSPCAPATGA